MDRKQIGRPGHVNDPQHLTPEHDRRLAALDIFIGAFETEHGEITDQEMADAVRRARARSVVVEGDRRSG